MINYIDPPKKLLKHIDRIADIQQGGHPAPVNVEIDLSNRCNLGCLGCHFAHTHTRGWYADKANESLVGDLMDVELAIEILQQLKESGVLSVTWTGGGEPTLHPKFDEIIEAAHTIGLKQGIYTNGTNISPERAELMRNVFDWIYISLDRADKETYKQYKRADAFDKAIDGIVNLKRAKGKATIGIGFLLSATSLPYARDMLDLGLDLEVDYIQFRPEISFNPAQPSKAPEDNTWIKAAIMWLDGVKDRHKVQVDISRFDMYRNWDGHGYKNCYWSKMQTVITPNGKMWTCVNRRGFDDDEIGDLTKEHFQDVWNRHDVKAVDRLCRVMCRGHIPNLTLDYMMSDHNGHDDFI